MGLGRPFGLPTVDLQAATDSPPPGYGLKESDMDDLIFGLILMAVGMGGTRATLMILTFMITILKKACPLKPPEEALKKAERS